MKIPKPLKYILTAIVIAVATFVTTVLIIVAPALERLG